MKARIAKLVTALFVLCLTNSAMSQSVNFRFNNFFYGWQRIDSLSTGSEAKTTHLRGYQNYLIEFNSGKWSFNTLAQTEEDVMNRVGKGFHYRFYNLFIKGTNLFNILDVKLGRQNIFAGTGRGTMDGLHLKIKAGKFKEYQLALYGGALTPYTYEFNEYPSIKNSYMFGAQFTYYGVKDLMASVSYANKNRTPESYTALRIDSLFNTTTREISFDGPAEQLAGLDLNYLYLGKYNFYGKAYYDITLKRFFKGEFNVRANLPNNFRVFAGYIYREPYYSYNSIFWVFNYTKNQEIEGGVDYTLKNGINIYGRLGYIIYDKTDVLTITTPTPGKNTSLKVQAGFTHANYGLSFTRYMGYSGESDGISGYAQYELIKGLLSGSASLSYSRYKLGDYEVEKVNSFSGMAGVTYRPLPQLSVDAQAQMIINRIYKTDTRFLIGFNYWLFKKL